MTSYTRPGPPGAVTAGGDPFSAATHDSGCPPETWHSLVEAFVAPLPPQGKGGAAVLHRLAMLGRRLPAPEALLGDPALLSALSSCAAVAEPPLYMAVLSHYILCLGSVLTLAGDRAALSGPVRELREGRRKGVFMVTEVGRAGSHLSVETIAEFDPASRSFRLRTPRPGAAKFSGVGAVTMPQSAVVCARVRVGGTDRGVFSFLVDVCDREGPVQGVSVLGPLGVPALPLDYAVVRFDDAPVPYDRWLRDSAWIDDDGLFHDPLADPGARLTRTLSVGQLLWSSLPSAMAAVARAASVDAVRACTTRLSHGGLAPGAPLLTYRTQQHAVLGSLAEAFAISAAARAARRTAVTAVPRDGAEGHGSGTAAAFSPWAAVDPSLAVYKAACVRGAHHSVSGAMRRLGLPGLMDVTRLHAYHGLTLAFETAGGDNQLIHLDTGQHLCREAASTAAVDSGTPDRPAADAAPPPWDASGWPVTVRALREALRGTLRADLARGEAAGREGLELWNPLLEQARVLGEVHGLVLVAEAVTDQLAALDDPRVRPAFTALAHLYAASMTQRLTARLLAAGLTDVRTLRVLPGVLDGLCDQVLGHLPVLLESMEPPRALVPHPWEGDFGTWLETELTPQRGEGGEER